MGERPILPLRLPVWDSPDGQDCLYKFWHTTVWGFTAGAGISLYELLLFNRPQSFLLGAGRSLSYALPGAGIAATFATTGCLLGTIRGKDDHINHGIAGALAGSLIGVRMQSNRVTGTCAIGGALLGVVFKLMQQTNTTIFQVHDEAPQETLNWRYREWGTSLRRDYPVPKDY